VGRLVLGEAAVEVEDWRPSGRIAGEPPHHQPYGNGIQVDPVYASDRPSMIKEFVDFDGCRATVIHPDPMHLWKQASGDRAKYIGLMRLHGHLIAGAPTPGQNIFGHPAHAPRWHEG
jgi:hypothetical protein